MWLDAGRYVVTFSVGRAEQEEQDGDLICAILDVTADMGRKVLATDFLSVGQMTTQLKQFEIAFDIDERSQVEFRVRGSGDIPIVIADEPVLSPRRDDIAYPPHQAMDCALIRDTPEEIVTLFRQGSRPRKVAGGFQFTIDGIVIGAEQRDDVNFVDEVFNQRAYNVDVERDQCVIDIGMNVGLTSLVFAARDNVKEVHAFEPFESTFAKARVNLALNPDMAAKIVTTNAGLSDSTGEVIVRVPETTDSGSRSTFDVEEGFAVKLKLLDAAETLKPIIDAAHQRGRFVLAKVDCEGSEFPIFTSLRRAGILGDIDAFMVEWHRVFADKDVSDLTSPLRAEGFVVIDLSPAEGNGFFYAVKPTPSIHHASSG